VDPFFNRHDDFIFFVNSLVGDMGMTTGWQPDEREKKEGRKKKNLIPSISGCQNGGVHEPFGAGCVGGGWRARKKGEKKKRKEGATRAASY